MEIIKSSQIISEHLKFLENSIINSSTTITTLVKREGWIAVCFHESLFSPSSFIAALVDYGYMEFTATPWCDIGPMMIVPSTLDSMYTCMMKQILWYILSAGEPDWIILYANTLDFYLILGSQDFIEKVLDCSTHEAFASIEEIIDQSRYISEVGKAHFVDLLHQLRVVYPQAENGSLISFEFT
jgi:hypothetical protein